MAFDHGEITLQTPDQGSAWRRRSADRHEMPEGWEPGEPVPLETTLGRALFNEALPADYPFVTSRWARSSSA